MDDQELLAALCERDSRALTHAIIAYGGYVSAVIRRTLGHSATREDREELVSDVFVALWQHAPRLDASSRLKPWLSVVARNRALNWARAYRPTVELFEDELPLSEPPADAPLEREERNCLVRQAVDSLAPIDRELFLRHYYWQQSIAHIAHDTGMNESTIKSRLRRGRLALKELLIKNEGDEKEHSNQSEQRTRSRA
ncbi:MAG: sigma-70 family RNA polymerase sigma factor [Coriobacteriales bacterium]|jgi:RNA polymerase sigma-70 factor (ECF subfamily)|nr:sigma-70 family RNA polymerase sigma factor [Coriobacteriales bacterium]